MTTLVMLDTETTGVNPKIDDICQFAAIVTSDLKGEKSNLVASTLCKPRVPISKEAEGIHGITNDMVKNAHSAEEVISKFVEEISTLSAGDDIVLGGHNVIFDKRFLCNHSDYWAHNTLICTMRVARRHFQHAENHKLEYLYRDYAKLSSPKTAKAHDALADVWMSYELLRFWMERDNITEDYSAIALELCTPIELTVMPFGKHKGYLMTDVPKQYLQWLVKQPTEDYDVMHTARKLLSGN